MSTADELLRDAVEAEKNSRRNDAAIQFERLYTQTNDPAHLHRAAINYRYYDSGKAWHLYAELEILLETSVEKSDSSEAVQAQLARVRRDWALLCVSLGKYTLANSLLRLAMQGHTYEKSEIDRRAERGATHGAFGRMYLAMGDATKAEMSFRRADAALVESGHREYELFNLMHYLEMKTLSPHLRPVYHERAMQLAEDLGYPAKVEQLKRTAEAHANH